MLILGSSEVSGISQYDPWQSCWETKLPADNRHLTQVSRDVTAIQTQISRDVTRHSNHAYKIHEIIMCIFL